jgi:toxin FitB
MRWLLDTNVISEIRRPRPSRQVETWLASLKKGESLISILNIAELKYSAMSHPDIVKGQELLIWIDSYVRHAFAGYILNIDELVLFRWRVIAREREIRREPAPAVDLLLAAIAIENRIGVATRDIAPFVACGLPVLNPWTGECFNGT